MRFDDRIGTVLAQPENDISALTAKWRQLFDLMAQRPGGAESTEVGAALAFLHDKRETIPADVRAAIIDASPDLPAHLRPLVEAIPAVANPAIASSQQHIRDLVARVEAHRTRGGEGLPPVEEGQTGAFRWESGTDGVMLWVEGGAREPLVGHSIASAADSASFGVDGHAAGAFRKRAPFRDARFRVAGHGGVAGDWRISGVPFFNPAGGQFLGYRGSARRPRVDEAATPVAATTEDGGVFGTKLEPDALRQLIHELRTPLNAIVGFSEMIDGQMLGPAGASYRSRAGAIREQARRLLAAVDDLDTAARMESSVLPADVSQVDAGALIERLQRAYDGVAAQRGAILRVERDPNLPMAAIEAGAAERMFTRLLAATVGLAGNGEALSAALSMQGDDVISLSLDRPAAIRGVAEEDLLDPGFSPAGDWPEAPALGLGFALRLVRNLAEAAGGALAITPQRFILSLPAATSASQASG